jgi:hypothetical protein
MPGIPGPAELGPVERIPVLLSCPCGPYARGPRPSSSYCCDAAPAATWCGAFAGALFSIPVLVSVSPC